MLNPHMLRKVRSRALLDAIKGMPCALRIASFIPGRTCAPPDTVVPAHLPTIGKGVGTKVSDLFVAAACAHCHDLLDGRDRRLLDQAHLRAAVMQRMLDGLAETQSRLVVAGVIKIQGDENAD